MKKSKQGSKNIETIPVEFVDLSHQKPADLMFVNLDVMFLKNLKMKRCGKKLLFQFLRIPLMFEFSVWNARPVHYHLFDKLPLQE